MKRIISILLVVLLVLAGATTADAKKRARKHRKVTPSTEQVWTTFGGTYIFMDKDHQVSISFTLDGDEDVLESVSLDDEKVTGVYNKETHEFTFYDERGVTIFKGKVYDGGNLLKGTLRGKKIELRNPCGL